MSNGIAVTVSGLTLTGSSATNYTLTQPTITADITPAGLLVTGITASNKVYDATNVAMLNTSSAALVRVPPLPARSGDIAFRYLSRTNDTTGRLSYVTAESYQVGSNCLALAAIVSSNAACGVFGRTTNRISRRPCPVGKVATYTPLRQPSGSSRHSTRARIL